MPAADRFVNVNIPSAQVEAVQSGQVIPAPCHCGRKQSADARAVEQDPGDQLQSLLVRAAQHRPQDFVPKGREFARRGQDILAAYHMEAFDAAGNPVSPQSIDWFRDQVLGYNFRQQPWEENSLGFVKINFPNKDSVYMHDTPLKALFGKQRAFRELTAACACTMSRAGGVAPQQQSWLDARARGVDEADRRAGNVKLTKPIAVYFAYVTPGRRPTETSISGPTSMATTAPPRPPHRPIRRMDPFDRKKGHPRDGLLL